MKKLGQIMTIGLGFAVLIAILSSNFNKTATADKVDPVLVTNTAAQAVPTNAAQNGTWNVGITGTPTVNVGNTPTVNLGSGATVGINGSVQVGNTATSPVPVQAAPRTVVQVTTALSCFTGCGAVVLYTVPDGKRLVVEYVSFDGQGASSSIESLFFVVPNGTSHGNLINIPIKSTGGFGFNGFIASEMVKFYALSGDVLAQISGGDATSEGNVTISGYLEDAL